MVTFWAIAIGWLVFAFLLAWVIHRWEQTVHQREQEVYDYEREDLELDEAA